MKFLILQLFGIPTEIIVVGITTLFGGGVIVILIFYKSEKNRRQAEAEIKREEVETVQLENEAKKTSLSFKWTHELDNVKQLYETSIEKKSSQLKAEREENEKKDKIIEKQKQVIETVTHNEKLTRKNLRKHIISYRRLFSKLNLAYWETDADENLVFVTSAWCKLFGLTAKEAKERNWQKVVSKESLDVLDEAAGKIRMDMSDQFQPVFEIDNKRTGEKYKVIATCVAMFDDDGKLIKSLGVTSKI